MVDRVARVINKATYLALCNRKIATGSSGSVQIEMPALIRKRRGGEVSTVPDKKMSFSISDNKGVVRGDTLLTATRFPFGYVSI